MEPEIIPSGDPRKSLTRWVDGDPIPVPGRVNELGDWVPHESSWILDPIFPMRDC